jgi:uncharacterized protein with von Willebrand factor type A (vWA) domain
MNAVPDQPGGYLLQNLLLFGRVCKAARIEVNPRWMLEMTQALEYIDLATQEDFFYTLRALMVTRQADLALFETTFVAFFQYPAIGGVNAAPSAEATQAGNQPIPPRQRVQPPLGVPQDKSPNSDYENFLAIPTYSQQEVLRQKDFGEMTTEELVLARRLMNQLQWEVGSRKTRRLVAGKGTALDVRQALRQSTHFGGEIVALPTRRPKIKPRPLVLLCDISGSMERYTRMLLHFMHTLMHSSTQVESFVFATHLTHITRTIRHKSIEGTLREIGGTILDWGGGTRIGDVLHTFNFRWARRVLGRGAVLLLITDGWDRGDPCLLANETRRLQHNCHRLIWLNPLIGRFQYEPLTRGAQAMLPYVDDFLPVRNLDNLTALAAELKRLDWQRPARTAHQQLIRNTE